MKQRLLKFVFITVLGLLPALASAATDWTEDKMWADPVELMPGEETTFILHLENTQDNVAGVQVSFTLPEGVIVPTYYDEDMEEDVLSFKFVGREKGHDIASSFHNGVYKVLITSMKNNTLKNDKSDLLEITLKAADDAALGKYSIDFTGCLYATKTTDQYTIDDFEVDLSVYALIEAVNLPVKQLNVPYGKTIPIPMPTFEPEDLAEYIDLSIELSEGAKEYVELDLENNTITGLKVTENTTVIGIIYTATNETYPEEVVTTALNIIVAPQLPEEIQIWAPTTNGTTFATTMENSCWLAAEVYPWDAHNKELVWSIESGDEVAQIFDWGRNEETEDGEIIYHPKWYVVPQAYGEAVVRATAVANPDVYAEFTLKVVDGFSYFEIAPGEAKLTLAEDLNPDMPEYQTTVQLKATFYPEEYQNQKVTWGSWNEDVATVDENGVVTAVGYGQATIYAYSNWPSDEYPTGTRWAYVNIEVKKVPTVTVTTEIPSGETITVEPEEEGKVNIKEQIDAVASDGSEVVYEVTTGYWDWIYDEENDYWYDVFVPNAEYDPETGILTYKYDYSGEVTVKVYVPSESEDTYGSTPLYFTVFFNMAYPQTIFASYNENIKYSGSYENIYVYSDSGLPIGVELLEGNVDWWWNDYGSSVEVYYLPLSAGTIEFKFTQEGSSEWQPAEPVIATINVAKGDAVLEASYTEDTQYTGNYENIYVWGNTDLPIEVELLEGEADWWYDNWGSSIYLYYLPSSAGTIKFKFTQEGNEVWEAAEPVIATINVAKGDAVLEPWYNDGEIFQWNYIYFNNNNYETPVNVEILEGEDLIRNSYLDPWGFEYYANEMGWLKVRFSQEGNDLWNAPEPVEISVYIGKAEQWPYVDKLIDTEYPSTSQNQVTPVTIAVGESYMYDPLGNCEGHQLTWEIDIPDEYKETLTCQKLDDVTRVDVTVDEEAELKELPEPGPNGEKLYQGIVSWNGEGPEDANIFITCGYSDEHVLLFSGNGIANITVSNPGNEYYEPYSYTWTLTFSDKTTGVKDVKVENVIKVEGRTITTGDGTQMLEVYNANGMTLYRGYDSTVTVPAAGIYIVRCGEKVSKIYVR